MPFTPEGDEDEGGFTLAELQAMEAAGDIEIVQPGMPEAEAWDRAMAAQLAEHDRELVEREGPDALTSDRLLRQAALIAEQDPTTIGHALLVARRQLGYDHAELARWLGVGPNQLAALAITPRPDPSVPTFAEDVRALAERYGADPGRLAEALA